MAKQTVTVTTVLDDFDGTELPEETEPVLLAYSGTTYRLYLSDANKKKLDVALDKFIKDAETVTSFNVSSTGVGAKSIAQVEAEQKGHTFKEVKAWALEQGTYKTAKGEPISTTAPRLSEEIWTDFLEKHK